MWRRRKGGGGGSPTTPSLPLFNLDVHQCLCDCAATEQQAGALVLLHPLVPHGLILRAEARPGPGAQDAAGHDDVLQQVLVQEGDVPGLGHVPAAAAAAHRRPDGEEQRVFVLHAPHSR